MVSANGSRLHTLASLSSRAGRKSFAIASLIAVAACGRNADPIAPRDLEGARTATVSQPPTVVRPIEDAMRSVERLLPTFGGVYYDKGRPIVRLTDHPRQTPSQVISQVTASGMRLSRIDELGLERADYRFSQLATWRDALLDDFIGDTVAHSLDLDERLNRVAVEVSSQSAVRTVESWSS